MEVTVAKGRLLGRVLGASMGELHRRKIYEREKDFSYSWSTHSLDREGLGVVGTSRICALDCRKSGSLEDMN